MALVARCPDPGVPAVSGLRVLGRPSYHGERPLLLVHQWARELRVGCRPGDSEGAGEVVGPHNAAGPSRLLPGLGVSWPGVGTARRDCRCAEWPYHPHGPDEPQSTTRPARIGGRRGSRGEPVRPRPGRTQQPGSARSTPGARRPRCPGAAPCGARTSALANWPKCSPSALPRFRSRRCRLAAVLEAFSPIPARRARGGRGSCLRPGPERRGHGVSARISFPRFQSPESDLPSRPAAASRAAPPSKRDSGGVVGTSGSAGLGGTRSKPGGAGTPRGGARAPAAEDSLASVPSALGGASAAPPPMPEPAGVPSAVEGVTPAMRARTAGPLMAEAAGAPATGEPAAVPAPS